MYPRNPFKIIFVFGLFFFFSIPGQEVLQAQTSIQKPHRKVTNTLTAHRYAQLPQLGLKVNMLPTGAIAIKYRGQKYFYAEGLFFQTYKSRYRVIQAPVGIRIPSLPAAHYRAVLPTATYFYYFGNFYRRDDRKGDYRVITAPAGALVNALPKGFHVYQLNGQQFYVYEQDYYRCVRMADGEIRFEVVAFSSM